MHRSKHYILFAALFLLTSCSVNKKIDGLWEIEKVKIGKETMTPIAKWMQINKDYTQNSGNGWQQHSIGNWTYDKATKQIEFINTNGYKDEYNGFTLVELNKEKMKWSRLEEGETVEVFLKRINNIPQAPQNKVLGVWQLKAEKAYLDEASIPYLFLRWDRIIINRKANAGKQYGTYRTHGHKNELQIIYYETPMRRVIWNFSFGNNGDLYLEREADGKKIQQTYERIDFIPK